MRFMRLSRVDGIYCWSSLARRAYILFMDIKLVFGCMMYNMV
jgi:hypothetical protein